MTEVGQAYVTLIPSAKGFASKMQRELGGDIGRMGTKGGDSYGRGFTTSAGSRLRGGARGMFSGLAKGGAIAAAAGGAVIGKVLFDSIGAASDLSETLAKSEQLFGAKALPELERFAEGAAKALGQSKQQALDASATFATFGKSAGLSGKDLVGFSTNFTGLASDLASFNNTTPQEAIDAIGAALRGEAEPMRRYGVLLDDASLRQEALRQGLIKTTKEALTPQQKVLASQALIYKQTTDAQGDFERTSGGMANQQRILTAQWENAKAKLGRGLLPIVTKLLTWANAMAPKVQALAKVVGRELGPAFGTANKFIQGLLGGGGSSSMGKFRKAAEVAFAAARDAMAEVVAFVKSKVIPGVMRIADAYKDLAAVVLPIVGKIVDGLMSKWAEVEPQLKAIWASVQSIITDAMVIIERVVRIATAVVTDLWNRFGDNILQYLKTAFSAVIQVLRGAFQIVQGIFKTVASLLKGDWRGVWDGIKTILRGALNVVVGLVRQAFNALRFAFKNIGNILVAIWRKLWPLLKSLAAKGLDVLVNYVKALPRRFVAGLRVLPGVVGAVFRGAFNLWRKLVSTAMNALVDYVRSVPGKLKALGGLFANAGKSIIGKFVDGMKGAAGLVSDIAGNVWDAVRGLINSAIDKINSALSFTIDTPGPGGFPVNPTDIPHVARGGRATAGTLAIIGEGREPETVFPDSVLTGFLERMTAAAVGASGGNRRMALVLSDGTALDAYLDERIDARLDLSAEAARALGGSR